MHKSHSPDLDSLYLSPNLINLGSLCKERTSPLSLLAQDLDASLMLGLDVGKYPNEDALNDVRPRRSLLAQLTSAAFGISPNASGDSGSCDLTKNIQNESHLTSASCFFAEGEQTRSLALKLEECYSDVFGDDETMEYSDDCGDDRVASMISSFTSSSTTESLYQDRKLNDFIFDTASNRLSLGGKTGKSGKGHQSYIDEQDPIPVVKSKSALKFRDQNVLKPPRGLAKLGEPFGPRYKPVLSHWNQKKPSAKNFSGFARHNTLGMIKPSKKREQDSDSPGKPAKTVLKNEPRKMRRSLTFNGATEQEKQITIGPDDPDSVFQQPEPILPSFLEERKDMLRRITPETLSLLLDGRFVNEIDEFHLIDCRYPYEFQGGHISIAININSSCDIQTKFFNVSHDLKKRIVLVFHCEYSVQRAPQMALYFRGLDRNMNKDRYPQLFYPDIYVLQGGYREFFQSYKLYCNPQSYIEMNDSKYEQERRLGIINQKKQFSSCSK